MYNLQIVLVNGNPLDNSMEESKEKTVGLVLYYSIIYENIISRSNNLYL